MAGRGICGRGSGAADRPAAGDDRRPGRRAEPARPTAREPQLPPARAGGGSSGSDGDGRLFRQHQGRRLPLGLLATAPGPGAARRNGRLARGRTDDLPRPRRLARARRRSGRPGDHVAAAGGSGGAASRHRAGRGARRTLRRPRDRPASPRTDHPRHADRLHAVRPSVTDATPLGRGDGDDGRGVAAGVPAAGRARPLPGLLRPGHTDRRDRDAADRIAAVAAEEAAVAQRPAGDPVDVRLDPVAAHDPGLVRAGHRTDRLGRRRRVVGSTARDVPVLADVRGADRQCRTSPRQG